MNEVDSNIKDINECKKRVIFYYQCAEKAKNDNNEEAYEYYMKQAIMYSRMVDTFEQEKN